jgi:hypothetical protein
VSREENNKTIVGRWFTEFMGATCNLDIVDELAAPDMLLQYSLHEPPWAEKTSRPLCPISARHSRISTSGALPISSQKATTSFGRWEGGGTHTGPAFSDFLVGSLPAATGRKMRFTGTTVLRIQGWEDR